MTGFRTDTKMRFPAWLLKVATALVLPIAFAAGDALGEDLSRPAMLIATSRLAGSPFEQTVVVAAPLPHGGGHIGFIINRPTGVKLEALFPDQAACRQVVDPVYLGGPTLPSAVFALTRKAPEAGGGSVISFTHGLFAAIDAVDVDRVIETAPTNARFFIGAILWSPAELDKQIRDGAWEVRSASADAVFRADPADLWDELQATPAGAGSKQSWT